MSFVAVQVICMPLWKKLSPPATPALGALQACHSFLDTRVDMPIGYGGLI
ncbi:hypothetical protein [Brasilonema bromeliae]|nr:hypothetical protein [Brasilonema bromeliae]